MRIADSRVMGILPLQHQGYDNNSPPWDLDKRASIFGIRILDRLEKPNDAGHWVYDPTSVGDIHGGQLFKPDGKKREVPMWRFATGVVVTRPSGVNAPVATPGAGGRYAPVATPGAGRVSPGMTGSPQSYNNNVITHLVNDGYVNPGAPAIFQGPVNISETTGEFGIGPGNGLATVQHGLDPNLANAMSTQQTPGGGNASGPGSGNSPVDAIRPPVATPGGAIVDGGAAACRPLIGPTEMAPILDENYGPDLRLAKLNPSIMQRGMAVMPKPAVSSLGITLTANIESRQVDLFFPTDNRLIAVNAGGDVRCGSIVYDLTPDSEIDPTRGSPLQGMMWVIKKPGFNPNTIAWNIGPSGCHDVHGGYVIDDAEGGGAPEGNVDSSVATPGGGGPRNPYAPVATPGGSSGAGSTQVMPGAGNSPLQPGGGGQGGGAQAGGGGAKVVARVNRRYDGPFDVGTGNCRHWKGDIDDDGHHILPLHIQWQFLLRENDVRDGPLNITKWEQGRDFDQKAIVRFGWNPGIKKWDWWTTVPIYYSPTPVPYPPLAPVPYYPFHPTPATMGPLSPVSTPGTPITPGPLSPVGTPGNPIRTDVGGIKLGDLFGTGTTATGGDISKPGMPGGDSTGGTAPPSGTPTTGSGDKPPSQPPHTPGTPYTPGEEAKEKWVDPPDPPQGNAGNMGDLSGLMSANPVYPSNLSFLMGSLAMGTQADLAKPVNYSPGKPNPATNNPVTGIPQAAATAGPVTGSMVAFGGEGGSTGSGGYQSNTGAAGDPWVYTELPGKSKYGCGTGPGGFCFMPAETDMQYARNYGLVPPNKTVSTMYVLAGPGAWWGAGVPELGNGTMKDGYIWGFESATGDLVWKTHSNSQTATEAMRFVLSTQNFSWRSGTSFNGVFDHANTANRTYTFPDYTGPVAMMLTGVVTPVGTVTAPESTIYWDTVADALYVNNNGGTAWTTIAGSGGAITGSGAAGQVAYWTSATNLTSEAAFAYDATNNCLTITGGTAKQLVLSDGAGNTAELYSNSTQFIIQPSLGIMEVNQTIVGDVISVVSNSDTGASSRALFWVKVASTAASDPLIFFSVTGGSSWSEGIDNSSLDSFKVSNSAALGTTDQFTLTVLGSAVLNNAAILTTATDGFLYVAGSAGTPAGTPTTFTGRDPITVDHTNNLFYFYSGGAWRAAGTVSGTGAATQVAYWSATSVLTGEAAFTYDAANNTIALTMPSKIWLGATAALFPGTTDEIIGITTSFDGPLRAVIKNTSTGSSAHSTFSLLSNEGNDCSIGIANTSFSGTFAVGEGFLTMNSGAGGGPGGRGLYVINLLNSYLRFGTNGLERGRLLSTGFWGFNTTTARRIVDALDTTAPQMRCTYLDNTTYTDLQTDSGGRFFILPSLSITIVGSTTTPNLPTRLNVIGAAETTFTSNPQVFKVATTTALAADMGAGIMFDGIYTGSSQTSFGYLGALKENATDGQYGAYMVFGVRTNGSGTTTMEKARLTSAGFFGVGIATPRRVIDALSTAAAQIRATYTDNSVYGEFFVGSDGKLTYTAAGSLPGIAFGGNYRFSHGTSALATSATEGFFHLQSCAGAPTGTPASIPTGQIPLVWDSTGKSFEAYDTFWRTLSPIYAYKSTAETVTNSSTLQDDDQLTVTLKAGRTYNFKCRISSTSASATAGIKVAMKGTCTATNFNAWVFIYSTATNALAGYGNVTALDSAIGSNLGTGAQYSIIEGTIEVNAAGTFLLRWAQNLADVANGTTVSRGSDLEVTQIG